MDDQQRIEAQRRDTERTMYGIAGGLFAQFLQWLFLFAAIATMMLTRRNMGYRSIKMLHLIGSCVLLFVMGTFLTTLFSWFGGASSLLGGALITLYTGSALVIGLVQKHRRWNEMLNGVKCYTYSVGDSWLNRAPMIPGYFRRFDRVQRFLEPIAVFFLGNFLLKSGLSFALGGWLMLSAVAIFAYQYLIHEQAVNHLLDSYDNNIALDVHGDTMKFLRGSATRQEGDAPRDSFSKNGVVIPSPDLQDVVNRMGEERAESERQRQRAKLEEERARERADEEAA